MRLTRAGGASANALTAPGACGLRRPSFRHRSVVSTRGPPIRSPLAQANGRSPSLHPTHFYRDGGSNGSRNTRDGAANTDADARALTSRITRGASAAELRARLQQAPPALVNATHIAAAMSACARLAGRRRGRRTQQEEDDDSDEAAAAARRLAGELLARLAVSGESASSSPSCSLEPGSAAAAAAATDHAFNPRDAASILASAATLGLSLDNDADDANLLLSRLLLLPPQQHEQPWPAAVAARTLRALATLMPRWQSELANAQRQERRGRAGGGGGGGGGATAGDGSQQALEQPAATTPPPRLALPSGWLDSALRATLPLFLARQETGGSQPEADDGDADNNADVDLLASLLVAAAALARFDSNNKQPPRRGSNNSSRRRRGASSSSSFATIGVPEWWAAAWLRAAERALPDASAPQLTRALDALGVSGAFDSWPGLQAADEDDEDDDEDEEDDEDAAHVLRRRQRRLLRVAYGQLYFTADQFTARELGLLLSRPLVRLSRGGGGGTNNKNNNNPHPPATLASRLAAYAVAKAAAALKQQQRQPLETREARDAVAGAGHALKGLTDIYRRKLSGGSRRRRARGSAPSSTSLPPPPPPPPPPLDPRLLSAARSAVLAPGAQRLVIDDGVDGQAAANAAALVDLLSGMAELQKVMLLLQQQGGGGDTNDDDDGDDDDDDDDNDNDNNNPALLPPLASSIQSVLAAGASSLSPQQVAAALDALVDLRLLSSPPSLTKAGTASSLWARSLLRASALRLRACRDAGAVAALAAAVARLCADDGGEERESLPRPFHPGRSWTLRTLLPAAVAATTTAAMPPPSTTTATLLRALAVLLPPLAAEAPLSSSSASGPPFDRARLVACLRAAVERSASSSAAAAASADGTRAGAPARPWQRERDAKEARVMQRDLEIVEAALGKILVEE